MKLKKCYVFSFGKLKDTTFNFEGGLNTIKQDNGWGKSTLASFIKCIFYGLNDSKKSVAENERLKYKTWNSTQKFGGFIEFEWGDREFKLERYFGNKQSEDTVSLVDLSTGKSFTNTDNLGARIFQIDEEGFLSTTYFSQKDFQVKSNTSITAKFNSICEMQDTEAFDKAFIKLEDKAKTYKKTGDKGLIADVKREIFAVGEQIQSANLASKTVESLKSGVSSLEKEVEQLKQKTTILTQKVTEAGKIEAEKVRKTQYDSYLAKRQEYLSQRAQLDKILNGQRPSEGELNTYIDCCNELNKVSEREKLLASDINQLSNKADNVNKNTAKNNGFLPFLLVSIVLACAGVAFVFTNYLWISIALFILSVFGIAGGIIVRSASGEKEKKSDDNNLYIEQKISDYNEYKSIREKYQQNISDYLSKFNVKSLDFYTSLSEISSAIKSVKIIDKEIDDLSAIILELEKDGANLDKANNLEDLVELKKQLGLIQDEYTKKANELARKKADLKYYLDEADRLSELEEKKKSFLLNKRSIRKIIKYF